MTAVKTNQEENLRMNSIKQPCKPFQRKDLAQSHPVCGCACLSTGGKEGIYRQLLLLCKSCTKFIGVQVDLPKVPKFPYWVVRTVWRKLCVLGIQRGLCCSSRNDARPWGGHRFILWWLGQHFSLSWMATSTGQHVKVKDSFIKGFRVYAPKD